MVVQNTQALLGLNYDKQNWQSIFSGSGNVTVKLPDGSSFTGPAWGDIATTLDGKAGKGANSDITSLEGLTTALELKYGGTGANTASGARTNLGLGSAATKDAGTSSGNLMQVGAFGLGTSIVSQPSWESPQNETRFIDVPPKSGSPFGGTGGGGISISSGAAAYGAQLMMPLYGNRLAMRSWSPTGFSNGVEFWGTGNTTTDANGFIKKASPVIKISSSGIVESSEEAEGVIVERTGIGEYKISGCIGLHSDAAWGGSDGGFEIPVDRNKQPRIWLDYEVNADGSIVIKTYHRVHTFAPEFAQNRIGYKDTGGVFTETVVDREPVDIPSDSFVSVRVEMPVDSIWNQKQSEMLETMKKDERERQQNQQDAQL
ncbi:MAG: hypothetical protein RSC68_20920 [Acinetobacter sp.]